MMKMQTMHSHHKRHLVPRTSESDINEPSPYQSSDGIEILYRSEDFLRDLAEIAGNFEVSESTVSNNDE